MKFQSYIFLNDQKASELERLTLWTRSHALWVLLSFVGAVGFDSLYLLGFGGSTFISTLIINLSGQTDSGKIK